MNPNPRRFFPYKPRKYPICGQVRDVFGTEWNVREVRTTKHGFDLHFGSPVSDGDFPTGLPAIIATPALRDYWDANRLKYRTIYDLPAGRTTLKRVRQRLGFHLLRDTTRFYQDRREDLASLPTREFMRKHGVESYKCLCDWRQKIIGPVSRPSGWWRTPETLELLFSNRTLKDVGQRLGIGTSHVHRLRIRAHNEYARIAA